MKTPICDFVENYIEQNNLRLHMPGHKGCGLLGFEEFDITEITGADSLYEAEGIIKKSQENTSSFFGCNTFFSTEGSTQCIKAMLFLAIRGAKTKPLIAAGRNAHKSFLSAAAVLDFDIDWLGKSNQYLSSDINEEYLENYFKNANKIPNALYITSPDYLGNMLDINSISKVCKKYNVLLLVDNAHGAYLKFLSTSLHPMDLGADMCADSAHKTLPALTGGAYLHISKKANKSFKENAPSALAMFGSTSPSYLILQSLDKLNLYFENLKNILKDYIPLIDKLKSNLETLGFKLVGNEPLKITLHTKPFGYTGIELAKELEKEKIYSEFFDPDFLTLMFTPQINEEKLSHIFSVFASIKAKKPIVSVPPIPTVSKPKMPIRDVFFAETELVDVKTSLGKIFADFNPPCPPAVPIAIAGETITSSIISAFNYYSIKTVRVVKK